MKRILVLGLLEISSCFRARTVFENEELKLGKHVVLGRIRLCGNGKVCASAMMKQGPKIKMPGSKTWRVCVVSVPNINSGGNRHPHARNTTMLAPLRSGTCLLNMHTHTVLISVMSSLTVTTLPTCAPDISTQLSPFGNWIFSTRIEN